MSNRKLSIIRPIWDYYRVRTVYSNLIRGRRFQLGKKGLKSKPYLNVGCGKNIHQSFVNIDYRWYPGLDLCWDITKGIPIEDNSVEGIFIEHCLEHLSYSDASMLITEFKRVLRPGGNLRIVVPDAGLYLDIYQRAKSGSKARFPSRIPTPAPTPNGLTPIMVVNHIFGGFGHRSAYDYDTLAAMLERGGFIDIRKEDFRQGRDSKLLIDAQRRAYQSLYVEASAPTSQK